MMRFYEGTELNDDPTNWVRTRTRRPSRRCCARWGSRRFERKHEGSIRDGQFTVHAWR